MGWMLGHVLKSNPTCDGVGRWGWGRGEVLRVGPHAGISALVKQTLESSLTQCHAGPSEHMATLSSPTLETWADRVSPCSLKDGWGGGHLEASSPLSGSSWWLSLGPGWNTCVWPGFHAA